LGGRTTLFEDPVSDGHKNGKEYLIPCLDSHSPIDLVILMLGTNDLKARFSLTATDIANAAGVLVEIIKKSGSGPNGNSPKIILAAPPPIIEMEPWTEIIMGGREKSKKFSHLFSEKAKELNCDFFDVAEHISVSKEDGIHYTAKSHIRLGNAMAEKVKSLL